MVYKNVLRAIDNIGINAAYVIKYTLKGNLTSAEMIDYLRSQVQSREYLKQASNFAPEVKTKLKMIWEQANYQLLEEM